MSIVNQPDMCAGAIAAWQHGHMGFGDRLRSARKAKGLTGLQLAAITGIDGSTISRWEHSKREPRGAFVSRLADALGVTEHWLLTGVKPAQNESGSRPAFAIGLEALEEALHDYSWPEVAPDVVLDVIEAARAEAATRGLERAPVSYWRLRIGQMLSERGVGRASSRPRIVTGRR